MGIQTRRILNLIRVSQMARTTHFGKKKKYCPHACGGVPLLGYIEGKEQELSPRMWGCTEDVNYVMIINHIVPTHVGVYR